MLKYEKLMARFRHMSVDSGAFPMDVTNAKLLEAVKGATHEERMHAIEQLLTLVPEDYWRAHGL